MKTLSWKARMRQKMEEREETQIEMESHLAWRSEIWTEEEALGETDCWRKKKVKAMAKKRMGLREGRRWITKKEGKSEEEKEEDCGLVGGEAMNRGGLSKKGVSVEEYKGLVGKSDGRAQGIGGEEDGQEWAWEEDSRAWSSTRRERGPESLLVVLPVTVCSGKSLLSNRYRIY